MRKQATLRDVAALAGVSAATVSRVLNNTGPVREQTRDRVYAAIDALQFHVPERRRSHNGARTPTIAVVLNHLDWPVVPNWLAELHALITRYGFNTIVAASEGGPSTRRHCVNLIVDEHVDGAIFYSPHGETYAEIAERLGINDPFRYGRGLFCLDVRRRRGFHVLTDEEQIGRIAASHLIGVGADQFAVIGGPGNLPAAQARTDAFLSTVEDLGHSREQVVVEPAESWSFDGGYSAMELLLAKSPHLNGMFVSSDNAAIGALRLLQERHIPIEESIAITSVDNMAQSAYCVPSLTTIDTQLRQRAETAVSELAHLMDDEDARTDDITVGVRLVVRESSRPLRPRRP